MNLESHSFRLINEGREGKILYQEVDHLLVLECEFGSQSIILIKNGFHKWESPKGTPVPLAKQLKILDQLRIWLLQNNIQSDIDLPKNIKLSGNLCAWAGCNNPQLGDLKICIHHFNLSCLGIDST